MVNTATRCRPLCQCAAGTELDIIGVGPHGKGNSRNVEVVSDGRRSKSRLPGDVRIVAFSGHGALLDVVWST